MRDQPGRMEMVMPGIFVSSFRGRMSSFSIVSRESSAVKSRYSAFAPVCIIFRP